MQLLLVCPARAAIRAHPIVGKYQTIGPSGLNLAKQGGTTVNPVPCGRVLC
ncbi:MAG: hypothetical protein Q7J07_00365 [Pelolinea sp.]|nr:hypothetical protein [Pelolinea sp.]